MNTTAKALVGWMAVAIVLSAEMTLANTAGDLAGTWLCSAALAQSGNADGPQRQAADLLQRARQAMAENDLATADSLISKAESLGVPYGALYMGDTPSKARHDLERKRSAGASKSGVFSAFKSKKASPKQDPFAARAANAASDAAPAADANRQAMPLPRVNNAATPVRSLTTGSSFQPLSEDAPFRAGQPGINDVVPPTMVGQASQPSASNQSPLRQARLALAAGDTRHAMGLVEQARAARANYGPMDDTPDRVVASIGKYQEAVTLDKSTEGYRRAYAYSLMDQAEALSRWGERGEAARLASQAAEMQVTYGPFEPKPEDLLNRIASNRPQVVPSARPAAVAETPSASVPGYASVSAGASPNMASRQQAVELVRRAREGIVAGQIDQAEAFAIQADQLRIPDAAYAPGEDRPGLVLLDIRQLRARENSGAVVPASAQQFIPQNGNGSVDRRAAQAVYDSSNDRTRNIQASDVQPGTLASPRLAQNSPAPRPAMNLPAPPPENIATPAAVRKTQGMLLFENGEAALKARDTAKALELFRQAAARNNELDPVTAKRLQDHLQLLSESKNVLPVQPNPGQSMADAAVSQQQILAKSVAADLAHRESSANAMRASDPKAALVVLEEARRRVETAGLDSSTREQLLRRVDRAIAETNQFIAQNKPQIELAEKNTRVRASVEREQRTKIEVGEKLAVLTDEFNRLMDDQKYDEAQVVAKKAADLDPENPVVTQILWQAKFVRRFQTGQAISDAKEEGFVNVMGEVDKASIPFESDKNPMVFGDATEWSKLTKDRRKQLADQRHHRTEREMEIEKKLKMPVSLQFKDAPLSKVLENLAKLAEVNLHLDPQGLAEEGVTTDTPVTIELRQEIMLKSALNLILEPLHLSYVIKDEVLKITSESMRDGQVYRVVYNVADLVIPIPNFVPTSSMGLAGAYQGAMANAGFGNSTPFGSSTSTPMAVVANNSNKNASGMLNPELMAQMAPGDGMTRPGMPPAAKSQASPGPGGLGGGAQADFDSLIELITSTVRPTSWDSAGGPGSVAPFETNLSLVVSQTQEVHEELADLLEQLRRLQDLQVTIEVRFITLNDNFFERIGVSFDFAINTNAGNKNLGISGGSSINGNSYDATNSNRVAVVGMNSPTTFSSDLDIPVTQGSYALTTPQFGGYDPNAGATLGFSILSPIEAYFFIQAAQGDTRSNVLQAPKVTLFNGQQAYVSDTSQSPFVISLIPVVGDFAAAQQPVIVVLSEGTFMTVQAVVSSDRRFVRLTVVPFFSTIGDVKTFQFTGSSTTTTDTTREGLFPTATDPSKLWDNKTDRSTTTSTGTTVQLPTFSFVTVTTTVSVPDGGTVLLGGIKRLSEGRKENGVPMLNKIPYLNRLFQNQSIGRETQSLMMMVTPRIIIQEEEEEKLGVQTGP